MRITSFVLVCSLFASPILTAAPRLSFTRQGVTVEGLRPGTKVAWMAMIREPRGYHTRVRIVSGFEPATPHSSFAVAMENADTVRGIWTIADVSEGAGIHEPSPGTAISPRRIAVEARVGRQSVRIDSAAIEVLYVRPKRAAWRYAVADGGGLDGDAIMNGSIVMPLASLRPLKGNPPAPDRVEEGDFLLLIDPRGMRTAKIEVQP